MAARKNYTAAQIINGLRRAEVGKLSRTQLKVGDSGVFVINLPSSFRQPAHDHRGEL